ncbi:hypothetical protein [Dyadobacter endophyticus]|nr:hypothetical protein [Dyadobacter endophyticus]
MHKKPASRKSEGLFMPHKGIWPPALLEEPNQYQVIATGEM